MKKGWFQGWSILNLGAYMAALTGIVIFLFLFVRFEVPLEIIYITAMLLLIVAIQLIRFLNSERPARFELFRDRARFYYGSRLHREVLFGPSVRAGIVKVGYWDDITAGPVLARYNMDPRLHDYSGYGPLFGYRFSDGGNKIDVSRKKGWDLADIQAMWFKFLLVVMESGMQMEPSLERYLHNRMVMGLSPNENVPDAPMARPERIFHPDDRGLL
jgi:hypothetical protein